MEHLNLQQTTLFFLSRDEMIKVKLSKVAYFEADGNYCNVAFTNGAKATLLTTLTNLETLLIERFQGNAPLFVRIGKRYIVNRSYIFQINVLRQRLTLTDFNSPAVYELNISKEALRNLKSLYS